MKTALAILALACLQACGGGGAADGPTGAPVSSNCVPRVVSVALLGDSTQWGAILNPYSQAPHNPGTELQADMDAKFGAGTVVVSNYAVSGSSAADAPFVSADVIVENFGINDQLHGTPVDAFLRNVRLTNATLIETPNPTVGREFDTTYVAPLLTLGLPVADVHGYVLSLRDWKTRLQDGVHPNDSLYKDIVDRVLAPAVAKQVAPLRCVSL